LALQTQGPPWVLPSQCRSQCAFVPDRRQGRIQVVEPFDVDEVVQGALQRLTLPVEATTALSSTLEPYESVRRVCRILVPELADWGAVDLLEEGNRPHRVCVVHRDPRALGVGLTGLLPNVPKVPAGPLARVLNGAGPLLLSAADIPSPIRRRAPCRRGSWNCSTSSVADTAIIAQAAPADRHSARPARTAAGAARATSSAVRHALVAIRYSHVRIEARAGSYRSRAFQARSNVS
jgi:hypothetical protein